MPPQLTGSTIFLYIITNCVATVDYQRSSGRTVPTRGSVRGMNWANRTVFAGDNLDVLRGMDSGAVNVVYSPPSNSNQDYSAPLGSETAGTAFKDTRTLSEVAEAWLAINREKHAGYYHFTIALNRVRFVAPARRL